MLTRLTPNTINKNANTYTKEKLSPKIIIDDNWSLGRMTAASKDKEILKAAANPRFMQGYAIGR